jgi:conjugative relaxase-like TrwC/TraI family protein
MLTVSKLGAHSYSYFIRQCQVTDSEQSFDPSLAGEPKGVWLGKGAEALGLYHEVKAKDLQHLLNGFDQDGEKLVTNAGYRNHTPGWGLVFAAPKSLSLTWALSSPSVRVKIEALHLESIQKAVDYFESQTVSRRSAGGIERLPVKLVVACFNHSTNQAGDVHLHSHCLVTNTGIGVEQEFSGALQSRILYRCQKAAGALYRAELAAKLQSELGFQIARVGDSFEIEPFSREKGIYRSLLNTLSSRRVEIERYEPKSPAETERVARATRPPTKELKSRQEVITSTCELAAQYGLTQKRIEGLLHPPREQGLIKSKWAEWQTMREARTAVVKFQSHFSERDLVFHLATAAQGRGIKAERVRELAQKILLSPYIRPVGEVNGDRRYTTERIYQQEKALLSSIEKIHARSLTVKGKTVDQVIQRNAQLSPEQSAALRHLCTGSAGLKVISGLSGSGKTQVVGALAQALYQSGYHVIALSHTNQAAQQVSDRTPLALRSFS